MIHTGLATDGGIHHGQQSGWHLHHADAPQPGRGREAGHVAHHATAKRQHQRAAFQLLREGGVMDGCHGGGGLVLFSGLDHQQLGAESAAAQALDTGLSVGTRHIGVADHQDSSTLTDARLLEFSSDACQTAGTDHHLIGIPFQGNRNPTQSGRGDHGNSIRCRPLCPAEASLCP